MPNLINSSNLCGIEYIYWPISPYRKMIFKNVLSKLHAGDVLDLGCGQAGLYWSMSYAANATTICFFDYHRDNLDKINRQIARLSPQFIEDNFKDTYRFLVEENLLAPGYTAYELASDIINKVELISEYDFRILSTPRKFDTILGIESIECVSSFDELISVLNVCRSMLKPGGQLIGICSKYDRLTERVQELIDMHFAGALNPNQYQLKEAFRESGFDVTELTTISTPELYNYGEAIIYDAHRN